MKCNNSLFPTGNLEYYQGDKNEAEGRIYSLITKVCGIIEPKDLFLLKESKQHDIKEMTTNPVILRFLQFLIITGGYTRILEIGSFIGVSALYMAHVLPYYGKITTIEKHKPFADIARYNIIENGFDMQIRLIQGDAYDEMKKMESHSFDFIFVDGNKENYDKFLPELIRLLDPKHSIIVIDDILFHGDVLNKSQQTEKGKGVLGLLEETEGMRRFYKIIVPIGNGILLLTGKTV